MIDTRTSPAARLDELTELYERHAYEVWNIALRTALEDGAAGAAAQRAFVAQVAAPDERRLTLDAARLAADAAGGVDARGIESPVLAATGHLAAVQRAALALAELTDSPPAAVAAKLGIDTDREQGLREGAYEQLGLLLGVPTPEARAAYAHLPWIDPPEDLWPAVYAKLHAAVTEQAQATAPMAPAAEPGTASKRVRIPPVGLRRGALAGLVALALAGAAWAATGGGEDDAPDGESQNYGGLPVGSGGSAYGSAEDGEAQGEGPQDESGESATSLLSPEELDKLRREEIEQLKRFAQRTDNERLPQRERDRAARKVSELVKLAQARQRAAERRELALRAQLARERQARTRERNRREGQREQSPPPTSDQQQPDEQRDETGEPTGGQKKGGGDGDRVETECLYDPSNGTYICPE